MYGWGILEEIYSPEDIRAQGKMLWNRESTIETIGPSPSMNMVRYVTRMIST